VTVRLVLDSSVIVAAMKPGEPGHADAVEFLARLRGACARGVAEIFAPPELWLEVHVAAARIGPDAPRPMEGLTIALVPLGDEAAIAEFLALLAERSRRAAPLVNATDLVYLWLAWRVSATLVTLDRGLLRYHGALSDVARPYHLRFD
jgi:predicted nucleic acid-binding protein